MIQLLSLQQGHYAFHESECLDQPRQFDRSFTEIVESIPYGWRPMLNGQTRQAARSVVSDMRLGGVLFLSMLLVCQLVSGCRTRPKDFIDPDQSKLRAATDVFWSLQKLGYITAKDKTNPSKHACIPTEYIAQKNKATFRISVFACQDAKKAQKLVDDSRYRHVDGLLRNQHEGGIFRRHQLVIIVRKNQGTDAQVDNLMHKLGSL